MAGRSRYLGCLIAAVALHLGSLRAARADEAQTCAEAANQAQRLRDARKLVEARSPLRTCAGSQCPRFIQKDCAQWLEEVDKSLPTVVVTAKDAEGRYLVDVKVSVDGAPFASLLDGQAVPMNPGLHAFHFERSDGASVDQQVPVREGEKNQGIVGLFAKPAVTATPKAPAVANGDRAPAGPWRTIGWAVGGLGIVGLGLGVTFGMIAASDKSDAACDASGYCNAESLASARSHATVADVGFIAGGALLLGGGALVLFAPRESQTRVTARTNGIVFEGAW